MLGQHAAGGRVQNTNLLIRGQRTLSPEPQFPLFCHMAGAEAKPASQLTHYRSLKTDKA